MQKLLQSSFCILADETTMRTCYLASLVVAQLANAIMLICIECFYNSTLNIQNRLGLRQSKVGSFSIVLCDPKVQLTLNWSV